jgi:hypothetical protein
MCSKVACEMLADEMRRRYEQRVQTLEAFGHRGSATAHERRAAEYLAAELSSLGLNPTLQPFPGKTSSATRLLLHIAVAAVGGCVLWTSPIVATILGALALSSLVVEQSMRGLVLSRLLPSRCSQNVWAAVRPPHGTAEMRVIICAHYDTQRTGLIWHQSIWDRLTPVLHRLPAVCQSPMAPVVIAMFAQCIVGLAASIGENWAVPSLSITAILLVYGIAAAFLAESSIRPHVPGASDNASGAAAVLTLAELCKADPREGVEFVLLLTGCEETGLLGAIAWADQHVLELRALLTVFLNLDGLGFGAPHLLEQEVPLAGLPMRYPPDLVEKCIAIGAEAGLSEGKPLTVAGYTDGLAFLARGLKGVTIIGCQPGGRLPNWHRLTDDALHMDFDAAWRGVNLAALLTAELAAAPSRFRSFR